MDSVYKNISHLKDIEMSNKKNSDVHENSNLCGYFKADIGKVETLDNLCSKIVIVDHMFTFPSDHRGTLTHELVHLFSQEYAENYKYDYEKTGDCGLSMYKKATYINEVMTEKIASDILINLGYNVKSVNSEVYLKYNYVNKLNISTCDRGYESISHTGEIFHQLFEKTIYKQMFEHTDDFSNELKQIYGDNYMEIVKDLNNSLRICYVEDNGEGIMSVYKSLSMGVFEKVDNENLNFADYLNIMGNINKKNVCTLTMETNEILSPLLEISNFEKSFGINTIKALDAISVSNEIKHFYGQLNKKFNMEIDLDKELNPFTRSKECTEFLIITSALKDTGIKYDMDKLQTLTYKELSKHGNETSLIYKYDDKD